MRAYQGDLTNVDDANPPGISTPEFYDFDVAAVGLGFHHLHDPQLAAKRIVSRLRMGGVLVIIDFLTHAPVPGLADIVKHHGFSEDTVRSMFEKAGAGGDFKLEVMGKGMVFQHRDDEGKQWQRDVFMARGTRVS